MADTNGFVFVPDNTTMGTDGKGSAPNACFPLISNASFS